MARKSRYSVAVQELSTETKRYRVAVYLRLSVEDGDSVESNSIGNQRKICLAFLENHSELELAKIYVDDGCTGMNYRRPGFQEMFADLSAGSVNCILTKDISRLGRHYIMTSEYVERTFPEMGVRLICINDEYDSSDAQSDRESLLMPFKLMMNDTYAKDTARRINSSIHAKMASGDFLPSSGCIAYGYRRDPQNNTYEIDVETAPVVQRIFELRSHNIPFNDIARRLNSEGIPCPGKIRYDRGLTTAEKYRNALWIRGTIRKMTCDTVYLGERTHGKVKRTRLGGNKKWQPKEAWQIVQRAHPAIISKELFDKVQEVNRIEMERRSSFKKYDAPKQDYRKLFQDKVFCGDCGARMSGCRTDARKTVAAGVHFDCNQYHYSNRQRCSSHYVRQELLMDTLKHFLDKQVETAIDVERLIAEAHGMTQVSNEVRTRLISLRSQCANMDVKLERLLEDVTTGILDRDEYARLKARYIEEKSDLLRQEQEMQKEYGKIKSAIGVVEKWLKQIQRYRQLPAIDRELIETLVDRILVYENGDIHISLSYGDPYAMLASCLSNDEGGVSRAG